MLATVAEEITLVEIVLPIFVAFIAFLARFAVSRNWVDTLTFFLDIFAALFAGLLASLVIEDFELAERTKWFIVAVVAMLGPDLLSGIIHMGSLFSSSPVTITLKVVRVIMRKPLTKEEVDEMMEWEQGLRKEKKEEADQEPKKTRKRKTDTEER